MTRLSVVQVPRRFVSSSWGGAETVVLETCQRILAKGHDTEIYCPDALGGAPFEELSGVPVRRFPYFYPYLGLRGDARSQLDMKGGNLFSFSLMQALAARPKLDLIHMHTGKRLGGIGRTVARRRGIPYIVSLQGGAFDVPEEEARTYIEPTKGSFEWGRALGALVGSRRVLEDAAAVICLGVKEQQELQQRLPRTRIVRVKNGVDPERFSSGGGASFRDKHGVPRDRKLILTVGRLDPQKNQTLAVRLLASLLERHVNAQLVLVGHVTNEAYLKSVEALAAELGVARRVTLIPGIDAASQEIVDAYHAADVFLLPSVHEPFGIVILEAWAAGLPVVASRVGGIPTFVSHGQDGLLFDPDDEKSALDALLAPLQRGEFAASLGRRGRRKVEGEYSWDVVTDELLVLYEDVLREFQR